MDNKSGEQFLIMKSKIKSNRQETNEKLMKLKEYPKAIITSTITQMMDQTNNSKFSPAHKDTFKPTDPTTVVLNIRRDTPLGSVHSTKIGGMWNLKHEIISTKIYELIINK